MKIYGLFKPSIMLEGEESFGDAFHLFRMQGQKKDNDAFDAYHVVWHAGIDWSGDHNPDGLLPCLPEDGRHLLRSHAPQANLVHCQQVVTILQTAVLQKMEYILIIKASVYRGVRHDDNELTFLWLRIS